MHVRPVTWLDAPADKGPKFVDHGGRYSIFLRRLRELISVTLQRGNAAFIRKWLENGVPMARAQRRKATSTLRTPALPRRRGRERPWRHGPTTHTPRSGSARDTRIYPRDLGHENACMTKNPRVIASSPRDHAAARRSPR